jgi:hypothetical protein
MSDNVKYIEYNNCDYYDYSNNCNKCDECDECDECEECIENNEYKKLSIKLQNIHDNTDISKNIIINNIKNLINNIVFQIDIMMRKIEKNNHEIEDFERIKFNINKINNLINNNNIDKSNFKIIEILEELNNKEIDNEQIIKIAISIYKKNFLGVFNNKSIRTQIINKNFYEFIFNEINEEELNERFKNKLSKIFLD